MAYSINQGANQLLSFTPITAPTVPLTLAVWAEPNATNSQYRLLRINAADSAALYLQVFDANVNFATRTSGAVFYNATTISWTSVQWAHFLGVASATNSRTVYFNGGSAVTNTTTNATTTFGGAVQVGIQNNATITQTFKVAMGAAWSVALTTAEITSLAKGFAPNRIRPQSLVFYAPLIRNLVELKTGAVITNSNTATVTDHPRVY